MNFQKVEFEFAAGRADQIPESNLPEIVFSGKSNVGKSSLINKLVNRKAIARVSSTPGKTATINSYRMESCRLIDLPGYGYAKVSKSEKLRWASLVEGYFDANRNIALIVQILDIRHEPSKDDMAMLDFLISKGMSFIVVCTKSDKLNKTQYIKQRNYFTELLEGRAKMILPFSALNGSGVEDIRDAIKDFVEMEMTLSESGK